jgi:hypothetical protein
MGKVDRPGAPRGEAPALQLPRLSRSPGMHMPADAMQPGHINARYAASTSGDQSPYPLSPASLRSAAATLEHLHVGTIREHRLGTK